MKDNKIKKDDEIKRLKEKIKKLEKSEVKRKKAEEKLTKVAAEQENIMGTISDGIYMLDMRGNMVNWNKAAEVVSGFSAEELMDKPVIELFAEDDRAAVAEAIRKGLEEGTGEVTARFLRKDRSPAICQWSTVPLKDAQGKVIGLTGVGRNITERKQAEEKLLESEKKYRTLVESLREGIATVDENENFTFVNQATCNIFGYSKKELLQMNFKDIIPPEDHQKILKQTSIRKTGKSSEYDLNVIRKNGDIRTVYTSVSPMIENQDYKGAFGIFHDITEQKRAEEELTKHRNHLEELVKERTSELENVNKELKRFNKLFVGREFRIKELKDKVKELKKELGRKK